MRASQLREPIEAMSVSSLTSSSSSLSQLQSLFAKIDTDKSGTASAEELSTAASNNSTASDALSSLSNLLSTADTDGDGALAGSEFENAFNQLSGDMQSALMSIQEGAGNGPSFSDLDTDSSDSLSFDEFAAGTPDELSSDTEALQQLYSSIDSDGDGSVSQAEFSTIADSGSSATGAASSDTTTATTSAEATGSAGGSSAAGGSSSASGSSSTKEIESETTVTNPDGSTTTTITYTDGTSSTTTTPASPAAKARQADETGAAQPPQGIAAVGPAIAAYQSVESAGTEISTSLDVAA